MRINEAKRLFADYHQAMNSVSADLKDEIQSEKKFEIRQKYHPEIQTAVAELEKHSDELGVLREKYSDPETMLAINSVRSADKATPGDLALISTLKDLPEGMLATIAEQTDKPIVQLALLGLGIVAENVELKKAVLDRVRLPVDDIKQVAAEERECLQALFDAPETRHHDGPRKITLGRRINQLTALLTE